MTLHRGPMQDIFPTLPARSVQLVLTSPPYCCGWDYAGQDNDRMPLPEYLAMLVTFLKGAKRVLRTGGVLALNVPQTIRVYAADEAGQRRPKPPLPGKTYRNKPPRGALLHRGYPIYADLAMRLIRSKWLMREPVIWVKSKGDVEVRATSTAIGAYSNPCLRPCHEMVLIASKGAYQIPGRDHRWPGSASDFGSYLEVCKDVWPLSPGRARAGDALAFPDDLVARLVRLYSNPGDVVLDPFAGKGTTARVARLLGREAWLIEREPSYWPRLESVLNQSVMFHVEAS